MRVARERNGGHVTIGERDNCARLAGSKHTRCGALPRSRRAEAGQCRQAVHVLVRAQRRSSLFGRV